MHCRLGVVCTLDDVYEAPALVKEALRKLSGLHRHLFMERTGAGLYIIHRSAWR